MVLLSIKTKDDVSEINQFYKRYRGWKKISKQGFRLLASVILGDETMDYKLIYMPNDDNNTTCSVN